MISIYSVLYALVLFSELSSHSVAVAMPAAKVEDGVTEQDGLGLLLGADDPMTEAAAVPSVYRRSAALDDNGGNDGRGTKVIVISDMRLRGHGIRGLNPAFLRSLPLLTDQSLRHVPAEQTLNIDRRDTDIDIRRCMIGRVYRPCWEV